MLPISLGVPLAIISVIGLLINGYILLVVLLTKQISPNNILLLHLGLVDSLLCFIFFIFSLPSIARPGSWLTSTAGPCSVHGLLLTLLHPIAIWTVCGLNCDRFYAIASPLHYGALVNTKKVGIGLGCGWLIAILLSIPPFIPSVAPFHFDDDLAACSPNFSSSGSLWYGITYIAVTFLLPAVIILGCNIKVLMIARYHRHRIASAIYEVTLSAQVTITHQRNPFFVPTVTAPSAGGPKFRSRSPVSSVLQLVGSFFILYVPFYTTILWQSATAFAYDDSVPAHVKTPPNLVIIASVFLTCSSPINGLLYGLKSKIMRKTFQNYWRKQMSKNEMNNEIQARTPSTCGSRRPSLTPLGFLGRPCLQRRMSETFIDAEGNHLNPNSSLNRPIKRIASEIAWRPNGGVNQQEHITVTQIPHTASCNTLQVPKIDNEVATIADQELYLSLKNSFRSALKKSCENPRTYALEEVGSRGRSQTGNSFTNLISNLSSSNSSLSRLNSAKPVLSTANFILHKVLRFDLNSNPKSRPPVNNPSVMESAPSCSGSIISPKCSPRIMITRAFSEESEKLPSTVNNSPAKDQRIHRNYSSHNALISGDQHQSSKKWKKIKYQDEMEEMMGKNADDRENCLDCDSKLEKNIPLLNCKRRRRSETNNDDTDNEELEDEDEVDSDTELTNKTPPQCSNFQSSSSSVRHNFSFMEFFNPVSSTGCKGVEKTSNLDNSASDTSTMLTQTTVMFPTSTTNPNFHKNGRHNHRFFSLDETFSNFCEGRVANHRNSSADNADASETEAQLLLSWPIVRRKVKMMPLNSFEIEGNDQEYFPKKPINSRQSRSPLIHSDSSSPRSFSSYTSSSSANHSSTSPPSLRTKKTTDANSISRRNYRASPLYSDRSEKPEVVL